MNLKRWSTFCEFLNHGKASVCPSIHIFPLVGAPWFSSRIFLPIHTLIETNWRGKLHFKNYLWGRGILKNIRNTRILDKKLFMTLHYISFGKRSHNSKTDTEPHRKTHSVIGNHFFLIGLPEYFRGVMTTTQLFLFCGAVFEAFYVVYKWLVAHRLLYSLQMSFIKLFFLNIVNWINIFLSISKH